MKKLKRGFIEDFSLASIFSKTSYNPFYKGFICLNKADANDGMMAEFIQISQANVSAKGNKTFTSNQNNLFHKYSKKRR